MLQCRGKKITMTKIKNTLKLTGFLAILFITLTQLNRIFSFKYDDGICQMEQFYKQEKDSVDVLVLGSSHAFVNISPEILYEQEGIQAYNLCASMQPTWHTYYYLKEALQYQHPKLIVMDVFRLVENFDYSKESKLIKSTYGMKMSKNKLDSIKAGLSEENQSNAYLYFMEFPAYHSRYTDLTKDDFVFDKEKMEDYKGFYPVQQVTPMERPWLENVTECTEIEEKTLGYFRLILELSKEEGIPILLVNAPYILNEDDKKIYNSLEKILQEYDDSYQITYIDFNQMYDELGIDFSTDFADYDHLNETGVKKWNPYLATFIKENYDL